MPPVFGGSPLCPTCGKAVYFAEKVIGPGGTLYHKLCLKCKECQKSLEPRLLVDHDGVAYCKACYGKLFGAKGYGAGGALVGEYRPRETLPSSPQKGPPTPVRPSPNAYSSASPASATTPFKAEPVRTVPLFPSAATASATVPMTAARRPLPTPPPPAPKPPSIPARPSFGDGGKANAPPPPPPLPPAPSIPAVTRPDHYTPPTAPVRIDASPERPRAGGHTAPAAPDFDEDDTRSRTISTSFLPPRPTAASSSSSASAPHLSPDLCPRCHSVVYHAESVAALSRKWHKRCLRCAGCGTTLMPNRLDERDGEPWCKKCYSDKFGLKGGMGVMTRPNLF
ncbi:hypothetical protein JCM3774_006466 [Rhodotorula dairenensis]